MAGYKIISADSHVVEPPDLYVSGVEQRFRDRAPRVERRKSHTGVEYDAWFIGDVQAGTLSAVTQAGQRFGESPDLGFIGLWEDVRRSAYDPYEMLRELEVDGVWGACIQPSQGLFWYRLPDSELLSALCRAYNNWVSDFCVPFPDRLKGIATINVDDVEEACVELKRCAKMGLGGAFIPVAPRYDMPYSNQAYERLWWTAQEIGMPLLLHIASHRGGIPGCEFTMDPSELTAAGRSTTDYWVRYSLSSMIFAGVFDRYPRLTVASVEHEMAWIPHWLNQMDFTYSERSVFTRGWESKSGMVPSDYWRRNMFVEFMEDDVGVQLRHIIGVDNIIWGSDFPHASSTWPRSTEFLEAMFVDATEDDRRKMTSENAARAFGFILD